MYNRRTGAPCTELSHLLRATPSPRRARPNDRLGGAHINDLPPSRALLEDLAGFGRTNSTTTGAFEPGTDTEWNR